MEHYHLRKYRGPETWARVRKAYEAGESGPSCALRFDVGLSNLRKKARNEGWDRKSLASKADLKPMRGEADPPAPAVGPLDAEAVREPEPPARPPAPGPAPDPVEAATQAAEEAARRAARGHGRGALEILKAADALIETEATLLAHREKMAAQLRQEMNLARDRQEEAEERQRSQERRRQFAREAELAEAEYQALLASVRARAASPHPGPDPAPAQPEAGEPQAKPAEPAPKPKLSFEERVRLASGKSGPESRW